METPRILGQVVNGQLGSLLLQRAAYSRCQEAQVRRWVRQNTDRDDFNLDAAEPAALSDIEWYLRRILSPVFDGD